MIMYELGTCGKHPFHLTVSLDVSNHHYCPSTHEEVVDPRHNNSKLSSGFMTDLLNEQCWQSEIVPLWAFGHTHFNCDFRDVTTGKRVMTNQRGYYFSQSTGFNAEKVVELKDT